MYLAMNRFRIVPGQEAAFEDIWRKRDSYLRDVPGFKSFTLLRGPVQDDHVLYASHSVWDSEAAFRDWTRSEAFRAAHASAGDSRALYLGPPAFEGFAEVAGVGTTRDG
ncbi:MAG: antibiotic biosynthesis monooxygenase [Loktanella sp.]|nr:antibiotic biosynthesis monooxygenase [Loktanella sp.]